MLHSNISRIILSCLISLFLFSCKSEKKQVKKEEIVQDPRTMDSYVQENIRSMLDNAVEGKGKLNDSLYFPFIDLAEKFYAGNDDLPAWSSSQSWKPGADSLIEYVKNSRWDGLFPEEYHYSNLIALKKELSDSLLMKDAVKWARAELFLTDAFFHILQDLKQGRLLHDSLSLKRKKDAAENYFLKEFKEFRSGRGLKDIVDSAQPRHTAYYDLKTTLPGFLDSMDQSDYTYLVYPYKDSLEFTKRLFKRLEESGIVSSETARDTTGLKKAIKEYQAKKSMKQDGKVSALVVRALNNTDKEKFKRIAITLDRYKLLPARMPQQYIWVNIPSYNLRLIHADTTVFESRVVVGKPGTPTPQITSSITDLIIYPTWTVPSSIIVKELLPGLKRNSNYLAKKGLNLLDSKGQVIDATQINWSKYSKGIPYRIQQGSGDDNALGVIKFNFSNPYSVYLHDTNQRYLFKNSMRSLSHGCVRVQEWEKLAFYIVRNDSMLSKQPDSLRYNTDSITNWIAMKEKHRIDVKNKFPLFIRYFGCEAVNGKLKFYDDIYGQDKLMREKYFQGK